jgi:uncharacterized membrane protein
MTKPKSIFKSKTFWVNVIAIGALVANNQFGLEIDTENQAALLAVINIVLRAVTNEPLTLKG